MKSKLQKINYWFLVILIVFIPFQALLNGIFEYRFGQSYFWLLHWYEPLLILFLLITVAAYPKMERSIGIYISSLLGVGLISTLMYQSLSKGIEGFRFTLIGILFFALAYFADFPMRLKRGLLNIYLSLSVFMASWALIEKILPGKYWSVLGAVSSDLYWGYGWHFVGTFKQIASFIGGPNQLASYLLPALFIAMFFALQFYQKDKQKFYLYLGAVVLFGLIILLTFSRSAALGLFSALLLVPFVISKNIWLKRATLSLAIFAVVFITFLYITGNEIVTHGKSQAGHAEAMTQSFNELADRYQNNQIQFVLGSGLGSAGPLAIKYSQGIVSESWYLQLFLEIGLLGVVLWLLIVGFILVSLYKNKDYPLFFGLIAVSITALFLHTWSDNPAMTFTLFVLLGINLNKGDTRWHEF